MNNIQIRDLIPRPVRDIVVAPVDIRAVGRALGGHQPPSQVMKLKQGQLARKECEDMLKGIMHLGLLAIGWFVNRSLTWSWPTVLIGGCVLSTPSMLIAGSFYGLSFGARALLHCLGTGAFWQFALGMGAVGVSYYVLEKHEVVHIGFLEKAVDAIAERVAPKLTEFLLK